ncbi:MAG: transposase, partial [Lachnospiraceae bacterium]|nr:transposase [Lachnospiraceae bacterium]
RNMLLEEYNEKADREYLRKESLEEGIKQGREEGRKEGREEGRKEGREEGIALGSFEILAGLVEDGIISMDQAKKRVKERKEEFILWYQKRKKK